MLLRPWRNRLSSLSLLRREREVSEGVVVGFVILRTVEVESSCGCGAKGR